MLTVTGHPRPGGSKQPFVPRRKNGDFVTRANGSPMVNVVDASGKSGKAWRKAVAAAARELAPAEPWTGPLAALAIFRMPRPKNHCGTGRNAGTLKAWAPARHLKTPDATKLWRSAEDALTGIVWVDDAQIVQQTVQKVYAEPGEPGGMELVVTRLRETVT